MAYTCGPSRRLRWEDCLSLEGRGCSEPWLCYCTPTWVRVRPCHKQTNNVILLDLGFKFDKNSTVKATTPVQTLQPEKPNQSSDCILLGRESVLQESDIIGDVSALCKSVYLHPRPPPLTETEESISENLRKGRGLWNHTVQPAYFIDKETNPR